MCVENADPANMLDEKWIWCLFPFLVVAADCKHVDRWLRGQENEDLLSGGRVAAFSGFARIASRKLDHLDAATDLRDLSRPGNRLKALKGRRKGQWSIRINDQWRICFEWPEGSSGPTDVEIVDYR